jgi:hypothetical protein
MLFAGSSRAGSTWRFAHKVCCPMHPFRTTDQPSHLTLHYTDEADRPPRA